MLLELVDFVGTVASACQGVIVHTRKAWLQGLTPRKPRDPAPKYDWVYQLKRDFPELTIVINGGIETLDATRRTLCTSMALCSAGRPIKTHGC